MPHSALAVYHETHYYSIFRPDLHHYGDLGEPSNLQHLIADFVEFSRLRWADVPDIEQFRASLVAPTFEGVLATFLDLYARCQGKTRGGEKTPMHFEHLPEILEGFPASPVIFLMRDPRDTAQSRT